VPTAALDGFELHYEERGSGRPLLLVAGIPAVASDWAPLAERLSGAGRVMAFDNRGSGSSTVTPGPYSSASLAADAVALLDHLGIKRADVFGMSLGGMIAQELALGWPRPRGPVGTRLHALRRAALPSDAARDGPRLRHRDRRLGRSHARAGALRLPPPRSSSPVTTSGSSPSRAPASSTSPFAIRSCT
jgi:pimeloyl-ACP methyl ester carboxylesterase